MKAQVHLGLLALTLAAPVPVLAQTFTYTFDSGTEEWSGDFADYPPGQEVFYELQFEHAALPPNITPLDHGLRIQGNNHSDDLFMFIKKHITGLLPNTTYQMTVDLEVASSAPTNAVGVGGAPGEGVVFMAGATLIEPMKVDSGGIYRMNIHKGGQSQPGADMDTLGHVGVSDTTTVFTMIHRNTFTHPFTVITDANGEVWVCIGTDSGYESLTVLYYSTITIAFTGSTSVRETGSPAPQWTIADGMLHLRAPSPMRSVALYDVTGRMVNVYAARGKIVSMAMPKTNALMLMHVSFEDGSCFDGKLPVVLD
jgi:hypothetical protein